MCTNGKCVAPSPLGGACDANTPCRGGHLYCNANVCAMRLGAGSPCASNAEACDFGSGVGCNGLSATPTCQNVAAAQGGQPCGIVNGTLTICQLMNDCAGATLMQPGACVAPSQDGTACSMGHNCLPPANCVGGICRLPAQLPCSSASPRGPSAQRRALRQAGLPESELGSSLGRGAPGTPRQSPRGRRA